MAVGRAPPLSPTAPERLGRPLHEGPAEPEPLTHRGRWVPFSPAQRGCSGARDASLCEQILGRAPACTLLPRWVRTNTSVVSGRQKLPRSSRLLRAARASGRGSPPPGRPPARIHVTGAPCPRGGPAVPVSFLGAGRAAPSARAPRLTPPGTPCSVQHLSNARVPVYFFPFQTLRFR